MATPRFAFINIPSGQTDLSTAYNDLAQVVDAMLGLAIQDKDLSAPPVTVDGDKGKCWIVGPTPTGAWAGQVDKVALCTAANVWKFITAPNYYKAYVIDETAEYRLIGSTWTIIP